MRYGFYAECVFKYSNKIFDLIQDVFTKLPLCAIVGQKIFCVHGGIGRKMPLLSKLNAFHKQSPFQRKKLYQKLTWSDPREQAVQFMQSRRGSGCYFNENALNKFLQRNNLELIIRSHEYCIDGSTNVFQNCLTIFSSTNYCNRNNSGAVGFVDNNCQVQIHSMLPLTPDQKEKRRIMIPEWLIPTMIDSYSHTLFEDEVVYHIENNLEIF